jgi:hypothetical protein
MYASTEHYIRLGYAGMPLHWSGFKYNAMLKVSACLCVLAYMLGI